MKLFRTLTERIGIRRSGSKYGGGVDAGRAAFAGLDNRDRLRKKNLLKRLNQYWIRQKGSSSQPYAAAKKDRNWRRIVLLSFCLFCAVSLFISSDGGKHLKGLLENIDYFRISIIQIEGNTLSSTAGIRKSSGIELSSSLFSVDIPQAKRLVKSENKWVKDVTVYRRWPDTLVIRVAEYEPHALLSVGGAERAALFYLDSSGEPFVEAGHGKDLDFPVITGLEKDDGEQLRERLEQPLQFLRLVGANNPNLPFQSVSELHVDPEEGLVVYLVEHPFPIFLGTGQIRQKYIRLRKVLEVLYKPRRTGMDIARVAYIRMDYLKDKVIVGYTESG